jgi:PadR family transcriptional regulator, regulatory protein PadR
MATLPGLEMAILSVLTQREHYGLSLIDAVSVATNGDLVIPAGSLYPTLNKLKKKGYVSTRWGEETEATEGARRKYYKITALGANALNEARDFYNQLLTLKPAPGV